jgi:hypothetical protein
MALQDYVIQQNNVDMLTEARLQMWHRGDFVVLKGPITVAVTQWHRMGEAAPYTYEPTYTVKIHDGETRRFAMDEYSGAHPGDWNVEVALVSED